MDRNAVQQQIADIDKKINEELGKTRLKDSNFRRRFPVFAWIACGLCVAWGALGGEVPVTAISSLHSQYGAYGTYAASIVGVYALYGTIMYFLQSKTSVSKEYLEGSARVQELQAQKRTLQEQLR